MYKIYKLSYDLLFGGGFIFGGIILASVKIDNDNKIQKEKEDLERKKKRDDYIDYLVKNYPETFDEIIVNGYNNEVKKLLNKDQLCDFNQKIEDARKDKLKIIADAFSIEKIFNLSEKDYIYILSILNPERRELLEKLKLENYYNLNNYNYRLGYEDGKDDFKHYRKFHEHSYKDLEYKKGYMDGYYGRRHFL